MKYWDRFQVPNRIQFVKFGDLNACEITTDVCTGRIFLHGAHVASYRPVNERDLLFTSQSSAFAPDRPIRGGVPICFPWFAANQNDPQAPAHGTARVSLWELQNVQLAEEHQSVAFTFGLTLPPFRLLYEVEFGPALKIRLTVTNTSDQTQTFEVALHSYFSLSHVQQVEVLGLQKARFLDQLSGTLYPPVQRAIRFTQETDRIYYDTTDAIQIVDSGWGRCIQIEKFGSPSTVVWNPWIEKSQRMSDFGDNEWPHMCCVETAAIRQNQIELPPDESHTIGATHAVSHI